MSVPVTRTFDVSTALTLLPRIVDPKARDAIVQAQKSGQATVELELGWLPKDVADGAVEKAVAAKGFDGSSLFTSAAVGAGQISKGYATGAVNLVLGVANVLNKGVNVVAGRPLLRTDMHLEPTSSLEASAQNAITLASMVVPMAGAARAASVVKVEQAAVTTGRVLEQAPVRPVPVAPVAAAAPAPVARVAASAGKVDRATRRATVALERAEKAAAAAKAQKTRVRTADQPKIDRVKEHIFNGELDAARIESGGGQIIRHGRSFDHVLELSAAQRGLAFHIHELKNRLAHPGLQAAEREALSAELSEASRLLDKTEGFLARESIKPKPK